MERHREPPGDRVSEQRGEYEAQPYELAGGIAIRRSATTNKREQGF